MKKYYFIPILNSFYLMRLVSRSYFKNSASIFTDFILPIIVMTLLFEMLDKRSVNTIIPGIIITPIVTSCLISLGIGYNEWKTSIIMKKIRLSQISTFQFFVAFVLFYFFISLFGFVCSFSYVLILEQLGTDSLKGVSAHIKNVNWTLAFLALIQLILIGIICGFLTSVIAKNSTQVIAIGLTLFLIQSFVLGFYLPLEMTLEKKNIRIFSYLMPFYSPARIFQYAWFEKMHYGDTKFLIVENWNFILHIDFFLKYDENTSKNIPKIITKEVREMNFHKSYWSLFLLGGGWIIITGFLSLFLTKKAKFD